MQLLTPWLPGKCPGGEWSGQQIFSGRKFSRSFWRSYKAVQQGILILPYSVTAQRGWSPISRNNHVQGYLKTACQKNHSYPGFEIKLLFSVL